MDLEKSVMYILIVDSILKWNWECQWFEVSIKNPVFSFLIVSQTWQATQLQESGTSNSSSSSRFGDFLDIKF